MALAARLRWVLAGAAVVLASACSGPHQGGNGSGGGGRAGSAAAGASGSAGGTGSGAAGAGGVGASGGATAGAGAGGAGTAGTGAPATGAAGSGAAGADAGSTTDAPMPDAGAAGSPGASGVDGGAVSHHLMVVEYPGRIVEISPQGKAVWQHQTPSLTVMFNVLVNGNVFYPHGAPTPGAEEIDRNHTVLWSYTSKAGELLGGERLANGDSLLGEGGPGRALELDPQKQTVLSVALPTSATDAHGTVRHIHRLANGNILAAFETEGAAREFDASGKTIWEYKGVDHIHEAIRLPNGNTLIGGGQSKKVLEVTSVGQIAWQFGDQDGPSLGLTWITSVQVLKNGNLLVCNWLGSNGGAGVHAFEVTRDKKIVWKLDDHQLLKSVTTAVALDD